MKSNLQIIEEAIFEKPEMVLEKSLKHCHVKGMHSLMLDDTHGKIVRMFYTVEDHQLFHNLRESHLAIHPHHCDLKIECLRGSLENLYFDEVSKQALELEPSGMKNVYQSSMWLYNSKIADGEIGFSKVCNSLLEFKGRDVLYKGDELFLSAKDLHTVIVPKFYESAWIIKEGKEDEDYNSFCYTVIPNIKPSIMDFSGYYQKYESIEEVKRDLQRLKLL